MDRAEYPAGLPRQWIIPPLLQVLHRGLSLLWYIKYTTEVFIIRISPNSILIENIEAIHQRRRATRNGFYRHV